MKKDKKNKQEQESFEALSSEELHMLRSRLEELGEDRSVIPPPESRKDLVAQHYVKHNKPKVVVVSVLAVSFVLVVALLIALIVGVVNRRNKADYVFYFGEEEVEYKYESVVINDVLYVDMNRFAAYTGMTVSGSAERMKYLISDDQFLKFENESEYFVINGVKLLMPTPAYVKDGNCLVPYPVLSKAVEMGVSFQLESGKHIVRIVRKSQMVENKEIFDAIAFSTLMFDQPAQIVIEEHELDMTYSLDISAVEAYIDPVDNERFLVLANPQHPVGPDYLPGTMERIPAKWCKKDMQLEQTALVALEAMMEAMAADGITDVYVTSAFRNYQYQQTLYNTYLNQEMSKGLTREQAEKEVLKYSAKPGTSEHQTGLCVDFITDSMNNNLTNAFEGTAAFMWLSQNAYKYGYILRYPDDKKDVVYYNYESWHYRFVGRTAACEIYEKGICLEEYLELIAQ